LENSNQSASTTFEFCQQLWLFMLSGLSCPSYSLLESASDLEDDILTLGFLGLLSELRWGSASITCTTEMPEFTITIDLYLHVNEARARTSMRGLFQSRMELEPGGLYSELQLRTTLRTFHNNREVGICNFAFTSCFCHFPCFSFTVQTQW
jgi:hypothetical protein